MGIVTSSHSLWLISLNILDSIISFVLSWKLGHENGFVRRARPLGKREAGSAHDDDVIFPKIDMCLIT
jgi:hypothetical protein